MNVPEFWLRPLDQLRRLLQENEVRFLAADIGIGGAEHAERVILEEPRMQVEVVEHLREKRLVAFHRPLSSVSHFAETWTRV